MVAHRCPHHRLVERATGKGELDLGHHRDIGRGGVKDGIAAQGRAARGDEQGSRGRLIDGPFEGQCDFGVAVVVRMDVVLAAHQGPRADQRHILRNRHAAYDPVNAKLVVWKRVDGVRHGCPVGTVDLTQFSIEIDSTYLGLLRHRLTSSFLSTTG